MSEYCLMSVSSDEIVEIAEKIGIKIDEKEEKGKELITKVFKTFADRLNLINMPHWDRELEEIISIENQSK